MHPKEPDAASMGETSVDTDVLKEKEEKCRDFVSESHYSLEKNITNCG